MLLCASAFTLSSCGDPIPGPQGEQGEQGPQGETGATGLQGPQGETGATIKEITFDDQGRLIITLTDGTVLAPVEIPEKEEHEHTFGEWISYGATDGVDCANRIFYHICTSCNALEWQSGSYDNHTFDTVTTPPTCNDQGYDTKTCTTCGKVEVTNYKGTVDHSYDTTYSYDNSFHWFACEYCDTLKNHAEHTIDESGYCTVCNQPLVPTDGILYSLSADGTYAKVIGYNGSTRKIIIADTYNGKPVKTIYQGAFRYNDNITSVTIPDSVTSIGDYAFLYCSSLTGVTIPDSVTSIGEDAFNNCRSLTSVTIPDSVTSIGSSAFSSCYSLTGVTIPDSVTSIGDYAFYDCDSLTNISVDVNNEYYSSLDGNLYDKNQTTLIRYADGKTDTHFVIPSTITSIGNGAFQSCDNLTSVTIPDSVTSIGDSAFHYCSSLTSVTIGNGVTSIGVWAFLHCSSLTSVTIPDSVTSIGDYAFDDCNSALYTEYEYGRYVGDDKNPYALLYELTNKNFTTYKIHEQTKIIGDDAFYGCDNLTSVTIPDSVTSIGNGAFSDCDSLTNISVDVNNEYYSSLDGNLYDKNQTTLIQYAIGKIDTHFVIPSTVTSIGNLAFSNCTSLTRMTIPDSVTSIGDYAFASCYYLTGVTIPDSVTSIGDSAFAYCNNLTGVTIGNSVTSIGVGAFFLCSSLSSVTIPDSVTSIGGSAFESCSSLTNISVDANNEYYSSLDGNLYDKNHTTLIQYAIGKTDTHFNIPSTVTSIGIGAFRRCYSLTSVTIPDSVTSIGDWAFAQCSSLTSVTIPDSVTSIGNYVFSWCDSLTSVTIPDSVTSIGDWAFYSCYSLNKVYYTGTAAEWDEISIYYYGNDDLEDATRYYYSESEPTTSGNYWHYVDGVLTVWDEE